MAAAAWSPHRRGGSSVEKRTRGDTEGERERGEAAAEGKGIGSKGAYRSSSVVEERQQGSVEELQRMGRGERR